MLPFDKNTSSSQAPVFTIEIKSNFALDADGSGWRSNYLDKEQS